MQLTVAAILLAGSSVITGVARTLEQRIQVNECAGEEDGVVPIATTEYFAPDLQFDPLLSLADSAASAPIGIAYGPGFKVLTNTMAKEQYVLKQCGTLFSQPTDEQIDAVSMKPSSDYVRKHFTIPLQTVVTSSSVQMAFVEALGIEDRVLYVADTAVGACWQMAAGCNASLESAWGGDAELRQQQLDSAEIALMDCASTSPIDCSNVHAQANGVHFAATQMPSALQNAEYVKFLAAFFNKESEAVAHFNQVQEGFASASNPALSPQPVVAWISYSSWSGGFVLSQATYKLDLVTGAGGANVDGDAVAEQVGSNMAVSLAVSSDPSAGKTYVLDPALYNNSLEDASAAFFAALANVDAVVDETYGPVPADYTMDSFYSTFKLSAQSSLNFIQNNMVFRIDGTIEPNGYLDWFESRVARPEWAVLGLRRVLGSADKPKKYFRNIATGEAPDVLTADMCTTPLPVCVANLEPEAIPMITGDTSSSSSMAWGWTSGVHTSFLVVAMGMVVMLGF